jgi:hypothetical protein
MTITELDHLFEVTSDDGSIRKIFQFDENPGRRAVNGRPNRKRALQEARTFAGKGAVFIPRES